MADALDAKARMLRSRYPQAFVPPLSGRLLAWAGWGAFSVLIFFSAVHLGLSVRQFWEGLGKLGFLVGALFPPAHGGNLGIFLYGALETLAMAFLGTLLAAIAAVPLGFFGARNVVANRLLHFVTRRCFDIFRGIDVLIWALLFVSAVGLGPFAGILAIAASDLGTLSKLFSEAIENADRRPIEGTRASGASHLQVARYGILPQVLPVFVSNTLYFFESNTRSASILGIVGAGGIGLQLSDRIRVNEWGQVCSILIIIVLLVAIIDRLSRSIRVRLTTGAQLPENPQGG